MFKCVLCEEPTRRMIGNQALCFLCHFKGAGEDKPEVKAILQEAQRIRELKVKALAQKFNRRR